MQLLLLHGLAGSAEDWCRTLVHLPGARAVTPRIDYIGAARSGAGLEELAHGLHKALPPWFEPEKALVAGNSLGGALALLLSPLFGRSILVAAHLHIASGRLDRGLSTVHRELGRVFHRPERLHSLQIREYERLWQRLTATRYRLRQLKSLKRLVSSFDLEESLLQHGSKTTLICGDADALSPLPRFRQIARRHPQLRLAVVERCGHAVPLERPAVMARHLREEFASIGC